jgi:hypothetical protein
MKRSDGSLFAREMDDQVAAAAAAVLEAERRNDPLLVQAARNHLDSLVALARRNGLVITPDVPLETEIVLPIGDGDGLRPAVAPAV